MNGSASRDVLGADRFPSLADAQIKRSTYTAVLLTLLLPPALGSTLAALIGFYPFPEIYLIFTSYTGAYVAAAVVIALRLTPKATSFVTSLVTLDREAAQAKTKRVFARLPWALFGFITLYTIGGALSADLALEDMGYRNYTLRDHLYNQLSVIPVVLITSLPIFFYYVDQLGRYFGPRGITVTAVPLWTKLMMLGLVVPLLIDSVLIGYYINRTGFFEWEMLALWFSLLMLAAGGTWLAWRSLSQGIAPLQSFITSNSSEITARARAILTPKSLDEFGVITSRLSELLASQKLLSGTLERTRAIADSIIDAAGALVVVLDREGRFVRFNKEAENLSGYSAEEMIGKFPWETVLDKQEAASVKNHKIDSMLANSKPDGGKYANHWVSKDGHKYLIEWSGTQLKDTEGNPEFLVYVGNDVTGRQQMESELHAFGDRLNEAQHLAKLGSWELDLVNNRLVWSDEIFRIFELDKDKFDASYEAFINAIYPDDRAMVDKAYTDSLVSREPYEIVHRLQMSDGRIKYVRETCETFFDDDGKPLRSAGTVQDISELHKAEMELREHRERLEELVHKRTEQLAENARLLRHAQEIARLGHWQANLHTGALEWSDEIYRIFGRVRADYSPSISNFYACVHPEDVALVKESEQHAFVIDGRHSVDHRILRPDGEIRWVHEEAQLTRDAHGEPWILTGTVQDITERKKAEETVIAARDEAERANRAKSEFLSRMSHELRTPLNAILGFGQLLEGDKNLTPNQTEGVHEIVHAGRHLLEMINEILDLSRIEAGRVDLSLEAVELGPLINECMSMVKPIASQRRITLEAATNACGHHAVMADRVRLRQILINLLSNAVKYNHDAGQVFIDCKETTEGGIRLSVRDTGQGIQPESVTRLFRPFERLESPYAGIEGTGIGLALAKRLTEAMDGRIGVDSQPGVGSTFWVDLPAAESSAEHAAVQGVVETGAETEHNHSGAILYIEDNPANVRLMQSIIEVSGNLKMAEAMTAEIGLAMAKIARPRLILMDINLPGMNGYEALRQLRADPATRHIPVIAITANAMKHERERGLAEGFDDYVTKPLDVPYLSKRIRELLDGYSDTGGNPAGQA